MGHTHEDIDQMFSRISIALNDVNTETIQDLCERIPGAYTPAPTVEEVHMTPNFRDWIKPHLLNLQGQSAPHSFKLSLGEDGHILLQSKQWTRRETWLAPEGMRFLRVQHVLGDIPGWPEATPFKEYDLDGLETSIALLKTKFLRPTSAAEWEGWIHIQRNLDVRDPATFWAILLQGCRPVIWAKCQ